MLKNDFEDNFFKGYIKKDFFEGYVPLKEITYCIVIIYDNNYQKEIYGIKNPWQFLNALKKNPKIKTAYIKE